MWIYVHLQCTCSYILAAIVESQRLPLVGEDICICILSIDSVVQCILYVCSAVRCTFTYTQGLPLSTREDGINTIEKVDSVEHTV